MKRVLIQCYILFIISLTLPLSAFAQAVSVTKNPPFPKQGERVLISISAYGFDLKNSLITWKQNNETLLQGIGLTEYTVKSAENQIITVDAFNQALGQKFSQAIPIVTSQVDMLWEAVGSYTPPFYKGKALPALEANINVVAIPDHENINMLSYTWEKEHQNQAEQGGRGKNSFAYVANPLELANLITVNVSSADDSYNSGDDLTIRYGNSEVLFYENDPEIGTLFNRAIKNGHSVGDDKEISLTAIPFFVSVESLTSKALEMVWSINGTKLPVQTIKNKVRLSGQTGLSGRAVASIFIKNELKIFEEGSVGVELQF